MPDDALRRTQAWLQAAILDPGAAHGHPGTGADAPGADTAAADAVSRYVTASATLTARYRLAIYQQGYRARLVECMRAHYPVLHRLLGDEVFDAFAMEYLRGRPSRSHTLHALGAEFADFLRETRPEAEPDGDDAWIDTLIDVARFERAFADAYTAPGPENRDYPASDSLPDPALPQWAATGLTAAPCLRLIRAGAPVHALAAALRRGEDPPLPPRRPVHLSLSRIDFTVCATEIGAREFDLLSRLAAGTAVGEAAAGSGLPTARADAAVRRWMERRLFSACTPAPPTAGRT
ncbi:hypothetical protein HNR23_001022 [Nocardiopsis mwathae]|uniref:Putative DNA-binding domain-containing protein n=1 Tax=Nocardiopsis mwathae TaxID=1472723 RepID=A0A7W9YF52_9ACTN|nr:DNA-binding domain-containing protein [Nocardiopsis mwathae]MBB6170962.1 hypothetical protein [Nocardiopsis mwathae]